VKAKDIALIGVFSALSFALMFLEIPLIPAVNFLKYDPSEVAALILALNTSALHGVLVIIVKDVLFYFAKSGDIIGITMNAIAGIVFVWLVVKFWEKKVLSALASIGGTSALMTALNAVAFPIYFTVMKFGSAGQGLDFFLKVWWAVLLFNAIKFSIDFVLALLLNERVEKIFRLG